MNNQIMGLKGMGLFFVVSGCILLVSILGTGCQALEDEVGMGYGINWSVEKSPITGRCYEIIYICGGYDGGAAMVEVPCEELP